ncbi:MAG: hypothetical protein M0Z84_03180 [Gammaproteobacteria bacterium]|nr:hypothetical protein [Gammaproteobacteria bacterium]
MADDRDSAHKPQFPSAPGQANKAPTVEDALAAAQELKPMIGVVRRIAIERRAALARLGKMALPPKDR